MPKATNPVTLSQHFDVDPDAVFELGVLDVTLAIDTKLFLDPLLLEASKHPEMLNAAQTYRTRFENIIKLLATSEIVGDVPWRNAIRLMQFHEVPVTCLGYGAGGTIGSGFGPHLIQRIAQTGKSIVDLGVRDPDLFSLLALFEEGIGADRISDMTTTIVVSDLVDFTRRVCGELEIPLKTHSLVGRSFSLPTNTAISAETPLLMMPLDCLDRLPVAADQSEICDAASENQVLRHRVNTHVSGIWELRSRKDKARLKAQILKDAEAMSTLIAAYREVDAIPYDISRDPNGLNSWAHAAKAASSDNPLVLAAPMTAEDAPNVVSKIISQFKFLVEDRGLWKTLYASGKRLPERYSQSLFFAVAHAYCKANNLDVSPEVDTGTGLVDFKFSRGFTTRVNVEIKLSTNSKVVEGYTKQIERYNEAEETSGGFYVVVDVGSMGRKDERLVEARNDAVKNKKDPTNVVFINGLKRRSASLL